MADRSEFQYGIGVGVPDVGRKSRGLELPPPGKTIKDIKAELQPKTRQTDRKKVAAGVVLGTLIGLQAGPQISEYVHNPNFNPQALVRDITSLPETVLSRVLEFTQGWNWFQKQEVVVPDTFDPKATKGVIGENNSVKVAPDVAQAEIKDGALSMPIIVRLPEGYTGPIRYELRDNRQFVFSDLPIGAEIVSSWKGKINQGTWKFPTSQNGSQESLQAFITARDEHGKEFALALATGRVIVDANIPASDFFPVLGDNSVPAKDINPGEVIATIASTVNNRYFDGQVSIVAISESGAANIQIQTKDGKVVTLQ